MKTRFPSIILALCSVLLISGCITTPPSVADDPQVQAYVKLANIENSYQATGKIVLSIQNLLDDDTKVAIKQANEVAHAGIVAARTAIISGNYQSVDFLALNASLNEFVSIVTKAKTKVSASTQKG